MKVTVFSIVAALGVGKVVAHSTFQDLWVNGVDMQDYCARTPPSNSPVQNVASTDMRCNVGGGTGKSGKCPVVAGDTVTIEMHAQPGDRSCSNVAIGGAHYGPVQVYLSKVSNSATADGSAGWFKIFADTWSKKSGSTSGDGDNWGTNDLNTCCGRMNVKIPSDIPAGDYLLRAEALALHAAGQSGQAQFYMTCYQLTITGGGSASPATVNFPGAYSASDPGILCNIHTQLTSYIAPGPAVYSGGSTKVAGGTCSGVEAGTSVGPKYGGSGGSGSGTTAANPTGTGSSGGGSTGGGSTGGGSGCTAAKYAQCGGTGYTGCTVCASGSTCSAVSPPYYSQCI